MTVNTTGDLGLLRRLVSESDIVVNAAVGHDVNLASNLIEGLKAKKERGEGVGTLIHITGTMTFSDGNKEGKWNPDAKVWTVRVYT